MDVVAETDLAMPEDLFSRYKGVGPELDPRQPYIVVLQHPVTTEYGSAFAQIHETIEAVANIHMQTVWLWPNVDAGSDDVSKGLRMFRESEQPDYIHFYRNFGPEDYVQPDCELRLPARQFEFCLARGLIPGRAGRQHRLAAGGTGVR